MIIITFVDLNPNVNDYWNRIQQKNKEIFRSSLTHIQITLCLYFLINEYQVKYIVSLN